MNQRKKGARILKYFGTRRFPTLGFFVSTSLCALFHRHPRSFFYVISCRILQHQGNFSRSLRALRHLHLHFFLKSLHHRIPNFQSPNRALLFHLGLGLGLVLGFELGLGLRLGFLQKTRMSMDRNFRGVLLYLLPHLLIKIVLKSQGAVLKVI